MNCRTILLSLGTVAVIGSFAFAQMPEPTQQHKLLAKEVGSWSAEVTTWMGEDWTTDPDAEPTVSEGVETNKMLGGFWLMSDFKGDFGGMPFAGHSMVGYDPKQEKYVASWVDSMTPTAMKMTGTYDEDTDTFTYITKSMGMDGKEVTGKSVHKYEGDDVRTVTMYDLQDGKEIKSMVIKYERIKK
jgi:hypothetical protein